jgi:hypothetical protein
VSGSQADDEREIVKLTVRYCWALDMRQFEELREVFVEEATADYGPEIGQLNSVDAIADICQRALGPLDASQHIVANHDVVLDGDTARCRCYFQAQHVRHAAEGGPNLIIAGIYSDQLVRTSDGWRIRHRTLTPVWSDGNPAVMSL